MCVYNCCSPILFVYYLQIKINNLKVASPPSYYANKDNSSLSSEAFSTHSHSVCSTLVPVLLLVLLNDCLCTYNSCSKKRQTRRLYRQCLKGWGSIGTLHKQKSSAECNLDHGGIPQVNRVQLITYLEHCKKMV